MVAPSDQKRLETKKLKAIHCLVVLKTTAIALFLFLTGSSLFGQTSAGTINMGNTTTSVATGTYITFYDNGGTKNYTDNQNLTHTFTAANGQPLVITFTAFRTQDANDYLEIYDGASVAGGRYLGRWFGNIGGFTVRPDSSSVTFYFRSNNANTRAGWTATITSMVVSTAVTETCSGTYTDEGAGGNYSDNRYFNTIYKSDDGKSLRFDFTSFNLAANDLLIILDGDSLNAPVIGEFNTDPGTILSTGETLTFIFSSNNDGTTRAGWTADISCYDVLTYYSYTSGDWDQASTWTLDASGTTYSNPGSAIPTALDKAVILNGRTVTVDNIGNSTLQLDIQDGAILDLGGTSGHNFGTVMGKGRMRSTRGTLPLGVFTLFTQSGGGTIELYGNITTSPNISFTTFNNLEINANAAGDDINLLYDTQINGYLEINTGELHFNGATSQSVTVEGNIDIGANGRLDVTNGNHNLYVKGDLNNEGIVVFSNQTLPNGYTNDPTRSVTLTFNNAIKNQALNCNGLTTLHKLVVDKGADDTYVLSVNASSTSNFSLLGRNNDDATNTDNPGSVLNNKALNIDAGTLYLGSNITIPRLLTANIDPYNNSFVIDQDATLILDGSNIAVSADASDISSIIIYGKLKVLGSSSFSSIGGQGIILREYGVFEVNGSTSAPTINTTAVRTSSRLELGTHRGTFIMKGGILNINGDNYADTHPAFALPFGDNTFQMSGGTININNSTYYNGGQASYWSWLVSSNESNISVTGGTVNINASARNAYINSSAPFYNLNITGSTTYSVEIQSIVDQTNTFWNGSAWETITVVPATDLREVKVLNNLNVGANAVFVTNNQNITVGRNFTLNASGRYTPGTNTTKFNAYGIQSFTNAGTITDGLFNMALENSSVLTISNNLTVRNNLIINNETILRDGGYDILVAANINNSGTHESATGGSIILNGAIDQTITGNGNGVFGNLTVNKTGGNVIQSANIAITGDLRLASESIYGIGSNKLSLSATSEIYDNLTTNSQGAFSLSRMIQTSGIQSDLGMERSITTTGDYLYPVGVNGYYTPARLEIISNPAAWGAVSVNPVNSPHPLSTSTNMLNYYWNVRRTEMSGFTLGDIKLRFNYDNAQIVGTESLYRPAWYYPVEWHEVNDVNKVTDATNEILFDAIDQPRGHYTAGESGAFEAVQTFYSRQTGNWSDLSGSDYTSWTNDPIGNAPATTLPTESSPVVIRTGHTITIPATENGKLVGSLEIQEDAILDLTTSTGHFFGLIYQTTVSGSGMLRISSAAATAEFPGGDFGDFLGENGGTVEYYTTGAQDFTIPSGGLTTTTLLSEGFEGGAFPPANWSITSGPDDESNFWGTNTQWQRTTTRAHSGSASTRHVEAVRWGSYGTQDDILISPPINLSEEATYELSFWRYNEDPTAYYYQGVWVSTTNTQYASFIPITELGAGSASWVKHTVDLSSFAGNSTIYIAFSYKSRNSNTDNVYIDDVAITKYVGNADYHHLITNPAASRTITMPGIDVQISGNYTVKGAGVTATSNTLSNTITVEGKTLLEETGTLRIDNGARQIFALNDTLSIGSTASLTVNTAGIVREHILNIYGNVINNGTLNLNPGSSKYADIYFLGTTNQVFSGTGATANINRVYVNKGTNQIPLVNITASTFNMNAALTQALTITNGTIRFTGTSLTPILTTNTNFSIPATGCLSVNGSSVTVGNSATNDADVYLQGKIEVMAGTLNIGNPANNNNNDIEYYTAGTPEVVVSGGTLNVNGQIRRPVTIFTGNLTYRQSGGNVYIHGKQRQAARALLEVLNSGQFHSSGDGNLYLVQGVASGVSTTFGELYLQPASYTATGGTIHTGTSATGATANYFNLYLASPIWSLTVNGETNAKTAILRTFPATFNGSLVIGTSGGAASLFDTKGLNVNIGGNLENYSSTTGNAYIYSNTSQITRFFGESIEQNVISSGGTFLRFGSVTIDNNKTNGKVSFTGTKSPTINGDIRINQGILETNNQYITFAGNQITNNHIYNSIGSNSFIYFYNTSNQYISGIENAQFGSVRIRANKAIISDISFILNGQLYFYTNSYLNIGEKKLTISSTGSVSNYNSNQYIVTNGALSDQGVCKEFATAGSFTFPVGVGTEGGKYTPATMNVTNTGGVAGAITVKPVDQPHPMRTEMVLDDELQYFWNVTSTGFSNPTVSHAYTYSDLDILGTETSYVNARMYDFVWYKQTEAVDYTNNLIKFTGANFIDGDYTAGAVGNWGAIHKYYSRSSGNWENAGIWYLDNENGPTIAGTAPNGNPVFIQAGHTVTTNQDGAYAGSVDIAATATLDLGQKLGHNMGYISGAGTIKIDATGAGSFMFPGGDPSVFMNTTGSTVHYSGAGTIPSNIETYQNILFSGNGDKTIPATNITVRGNLTINGGYLNNSINNRTITLYGNWINNVAGGYKYGTSTVVLANGNAQTITATGGETFYNLTVNKTAGTVATLNSPVSVNRVLTLTSGIVSTETNLLTLTWGDASAVVGGSSTSYVDGPLRKLVYNSGSFTFPVGDDGRYGQVYISGVTSGSNQYWTGRYYNVPPVDQTNLTAPLKLVSNNEYWEVTGTAGTTANVRVRWDANSQIIPATALGREKLRVAQYTASWAKVGETIVDGGQTSGTVATSTPIAHDGTAKVFTLGLELTASAQITGTDAGMCDDGSTLPVTIVVAGSAPLSVTYQINGVDVSPSLTNLSEGTHTINFTYDELYARAGAGDYIISLKDVYDKDNQSGIVLAGTATLTLYPTPTPIISGPTSVMINETNNFSVTSTVGHSYQWTVISGLASVDLLTNDTSPTVSVTWSGTSGTVILQLVETTPAPNSCSTTVTYEVTVRDWPVIVGNFSVCANSTETYYTKQVAGHTYVWSVLGGTIQSGAGTYTITVLWSTETAGTITLQQGVSPTLTEISQNVTINPAPTAALNIDGSASVCDNDNVTLLLGRSGAGAFFTFYLQQDGVDVMSFDQSVATTNPYSYLVTEDNIPWTTGAPYHDYTFRLRVVNSTTGCSSGWDSEVISVYKIPETGPQYHVPNTYGF